MADVYRCIHCDGLYPREYASVVPMPATEGNPLPIGVCNRVRCRVAHEKCRNQKPGNSNDVYWGGVPRVYWGTCLDCAGAVWQLRPGTWKGSWNWRCAKCGMRWPERPPDDEVRRE